jgi:Transglycosylase SLT domain/Peptidase family M23
VVRSRKLFVVVGAAAALAVSGIAALPTASADTCVVTVTLVGGAKDTFTVNVPPGTPLSSIHLPVTGPVQSVSESCSSTPTTTSTPSTTSSSTTTTSTTTTTSHKTPHPTKSTTTTPTSKVQQPSHHSAPKSSRPNKATGKSKKPHSRKQTSKKKTTKPAPSTGSGGVPTPSNPTFSFSLPGPAPLGVPNFFIDSFQIPPFLLPIYQAAGIQYDVPWQVLAAINEIETDYGRNLSVSSAGAVGWMQFLPSTWKEWGVDANGDGVADPYNPVDAIFTAARYLHAAGASKNLSQAIFAYNHASWYVQSVLLRAKLIGGMPQKLIGALTGLVEGHFPVAAPAKYADSNVDRLAKQRVKGSNAAEAIDSEPGDTGVSIFAKQNSPVIAVNDGKIVKIGQSQQLGRYIELQDSTGNVYTYAHLGTIPSKYPVPKPVKLTAKQLAKELSAPGPTPKPQAPASAGTQQASTTPSTSKATKVVKKSSPLTLPVSPAPASQPAQPVAAGMVKERLFADPSRPASYAAGGSEQLKSSAAEISNFRDYFSDVLHLGKNQYKLEPLKAGAIVVAGTILGRIAAPSKTTASHIVFMIRPAGKNAPLIDPKPILDGWKLLEATAVYRAAGIDPFFGPGAKNPTIGQVLLMSKAQLQNRVLVDPHVQVYACGRRDIQAGLVDRRVLATIEFLSASGLYPTVSGLVCGSNGNPAFASGTSVNISRINNVPIQGHQGPGSITDITIRRLLTLQGAMAPDEIISLMSYKDQPTTLSLPDHGNRIQVTYTPAFGSNKKLSGEIKSILKPGQWIQLINRISQIPEPVVPIAPSKYAIRTGNGG